MNRDGRQGIGLLLFCNIIFFVVSSFIQSSALMPSNIIRRRIPYNTRNSKLVRLFNLFNAIDDEDAVEIIRLIRQYPYLIIMQDSKGYTPLHHAVAEQKARSLSALLTCENIEKSFRIKARITGYTPLHLAVVYPCSWLTNYLLNSNNICFVFCCKDEINGDTPLHLAIRLRNLNAIGSLLTHKYIKFAFGKKNKQNLTPLELFYRLKRLRNDYDDSLYLDILERAYKESGLLQAFHALRIVSSKAIQRRT